MTRLWVWLLMALLLTASAQVQGESSINDALQFVVAEWAYEVRGEADYDPNPSGVFQRGSRAYAYLEVEGFAVGTEAGEPVVDLRVDVALRSRGGLKLFYQAGLVEFTLTQPAFPPERVWFYIWVDIPWWAPRATYRAEVTVRDLVAQKDVSLEREITVE